MGCPIGGVWCLCFQLDRGPTHHKGPRRRLGGTDARGAACNQGGSWQSLTLRRVSPFVRSRSNPRGPRSGLAALDARVSPVDEELGSSVPAGVESSLTATVGVHHSVLRGCEGGDHEPRSARGQRRGAYAARCAPIPLGDACVHRRRSRSSRRESLRADPPLRGPGSACGSSKVGLELI